MHSAFTWFCLKAQASISFSLAQGPQTLPLWNLWPVCPALEFQALFTFLPVAECSWLLLKPHRIRFTSGLTTVLFIWKRRMQSQSLCFLPPIDWESVNTVSKASLCGPCDVGATSYLSAHPVQAWEACLGLSLMCWWQLYGQMWHRSVRVYISHWHTLHFLLHIPRGKLSQQTTIINLHLNGIFTQRVFACVISLGLHSHSK